MKKILLIALILFSAGKVALYGQQSPHGSGKISPGGTFDAVFDRFGNQYQLKDLLIKKPAKDPHGGDVLNENVVIPSYLLCTAGYFDLYFEEGSGFELNSPQHISRRNVVCQVFTDISKFITPVDPNVRINIWVRNIANVVNYPMVHSALGLATSFYVLPNIGTNLTVGGIVDGQIWQTINSGTDAYTNVASPLITNGTTPGSGAFYHGMMAFNFVNSQVTWHTNLTTSTAVNTYDLYSVVLHEVTHALGFASLINSNGGSNFGPNYPYYSRYDLLLQDQSAQNLITNNSSCSLYDYTFNPGLIPSVTLSPNPVPNCPTDNTVCSTALVFAGTVNQAVYTPDCFEPGSSLSHLEDQCYSPTPYANNQYYCMSNANGSGIAYMKRYLKPEERSVLCDIGYNTDTYYGNTLYVDNNYTYGGSTCAGLDVAGVIDGINSNGTYAWITPANSAINFLGSDLLGNDHNADEFECLEVINGLGNVGITAGNSGTNINFMAGSVDGVVLLRYIPVNTTTSNRGNITYAYIIISSSNCPPTACNMVLNDGFETGTGCGEYTIDNPVIDCWEPLVETPAYIVRGCAPLSNPDLTIPTGPSVSVPSSDTWNGGSNNTVLGIGFDNNLLGDVQQTMLASPMMPNVSYTLRFWAKSANSGLGSNYYGKNVLWFRADVATLAPITFSSFLTTGEYLTNALIPDDGEWHYYSIEVSFSGSQPLQNLMIGNISGHSAGGNGSLALIDDVSLVPTNDNPRFSPPVALCEGITVINDLSKFIFPTMLPGSSLTGPGVTYSGGIYSFTASGNGLYTIFYNYTSNTGCTVSLPAQIRVIPNITPIVSLSSLPMTPPAICDGQPVTITAHGAFTYAWYSPHLGGANIPCSGPCNSITVTPPAPGYLFTVIGTDTAGCGDTAEIFITVSPCGPGGGGPPTAQPLKMPDDVKHYTTKVVPNTNDHSIMVGTIFHSQSGGVNTIHFLYLDNTGNVIFSKEYTSDYIDERAVDLQPFTDILGNLRWYIVCQARNGNQDLVKVLCVDNTGTILSQQVYAGQNGENLYPMNSTVYADNLLDNRLYICGYQTAGGGLPDYNTPKQAFVLGIDIDWGTTTYLDPMFSMAYDWNINWPTNTQDYDIATRISVLFNNNTLWVTGSTNGVVTSGPSPWGKSPDRSATMNLVIDPNSGAVIQDNRFLLDFGSDDKTGPLDYGIDLIEVNGGYYLLGNSTLIVHSNPANPGNNPALMYPRPHKLWWVQRLDNSFAPIGQRSQFLNYYNHWASHAVHTSGSKVVVATILEVPYLTCIPLPNTPHYSNLQVNLITVDLGTTPFGTFQSGPNKLYRTSTGTGDPVFVTNSFYNLGDELSLIDYPPTFLAKGTNQFICNAPKYNDGKLNIKYISPDFGSLSVPCGIYDFNQPNCYINNTLANSNTYFIDIPNMAPQTGRTDIPITIIKDPAPAYSVEHYYDMEWIYPCHDDSDPNADFISGPQSKISPQSFVPKTTVYPNPASSSVIIKLANDIPADAWINIKISNMLGQLIAEPYKGKAYPQIPVLLPSLAEGVYLIEVTSNDKSILKEKLLIKK